MSEYLQRRQQLMKSLLPNSIAFIPAGKNIIRNGMDNVFQFRQNSDFLYLTGFNEPDAVLVLIPGRDKGEVILFNRANDPTKELWDGVRAGQDGACKDYGADQSFDIEKFVSMLPELLMGRSQIYYPVGRDMSFDRKILTAFNNIRNKIRKGLVAPEQFINVEMPLHALRLRKTPHELELMRHVNRISSEAHIQLMRACKPGMNENDLEAIFRYHCHLQGCRELAYPAIVCAGKNTCVLHYGDNNTQINDGDLILVDAGAEHQGYSSDITRTYPANGKFSGEQRALYEVVLEAQNAVLDLIKPGLVWDEMQKAVVKTVTAGLVDLGILAGNVDDLIESKAYFPYYMHLSSHWLGLDTHDAGNYLEQGESIKLAPNMVTTVEPGLYIAAGSDCDERWWNMGIRIEDDVVVTESGHENLTVVPKTIDEIEELMRG